MKESVGYTVILNIAITFIIIVFAFLSAAIIYFKSNKISNVVANSIEKYEGYNDFSIEEIDRQIGSLGYNKSRINCGSTPSGCTNKTGSNSENGYCVFECEAKTSGYYYYKIKTNMMINIPIINNLLPIPIYSSTSEMFDFNS